ncbi:MAG: Gfo/Idh/MocA family oxidoreductase [Chloroflexota bacterium]
METTRWGILSTGWIAAQLAQAMTDQPDAEILAVGSRTQVSADAFGDQWNIPRRYGSYEALANDPDLDVIFIGTPHTFHYENMLLCLNAGKHVLCEKPLTINAAQAEECIALARQKGLFLMEAMWMRFLPAIRALNERLSEGALGEVRLVEADFVIPKPYDPHHRLYDPYLGGGALLDLGVYPISFTHMILGTPDQMLSHAHLGETNVDELATMIFIYNSGKSAVLTTSQRLVHPVEALVVGTEGYARVHSMFFRAQRFSVQIGEEGKEQVFDYPYESNGYIHEVRAVQACLQAGKLESDLMPLDESLAIMQIMDELRSGWGVFYPGVPEYKGG